MTAFYAAFDAWMRNATEADVLAVLESDDDVRAMTEGKRVPHADVAHAQPVCASTSAPPPPASDNIELIKITSGGGGGGFRSCTRAPVVVAVLVAVFAALFVAA